MEAKTILESMPDALRHEVAVAALECNAARRRYDEGPRTGEPRREFEHRAFSAYKGASRYLNGLIIGWLVARGIPREAGLTVKRAAMDAARAEFGV